MRQKLELRDKIREAINVSVGEDKLNTSCGSGLPHVWIIGKEEENTTLTEQTQGVWHLFENSCSPWLYPYTSNTTNAVPYKSKTTTLAMGYTYPSVTNIQENHAYYDYLVQQAGPISPGDILFIGEDACWGTSPHQCIKYVGTTTGWPGNGLQFHGATFFAGPYQDCSSCNVDPTNYGCSDPNALNTDISPNFSSWIAQYNGTGGYPIIGVDCDGSWANGTSYGSSWQVNVPNMTPTGSGPQPWCVPSGVSFPSIACCSYNPGCIDNGMFSNSPTPGVPALNYDPNANGDCGSKPCSENESWISDHGCCQYPTPILGCTDSAATNYDPLATVDDGSCIYPVNEDKGCLDINALNYNACCNGDPACIVISSNPDCCRYQQGDHKGCMDITAINYMICCDPNIPGCVPNSPSPDCCRYEGEPDPCKDNPKECWFCESGDINTSDWQDPMALVNANGGCVQFLNTNSTFASNYTGQMYTTQSDCTNNSECKPTRGGDKQKNCTCCKKTEGGTISGFSPSTSIPVSDSCSQFNGQNGSYGCVETTLWSLSKCSQELPNDDWPIGLDESIIRMQKLANISKK